MPLERHEATRAGIHSPDDAPYGTHGYRAGRFVLPDLTVEQMQARVLAKLRKVGVPEPRAPMGQSSARAWSAARSLAG